MHMNAAILVIIYLSLLKNVNKSRDNLFDDE